MATKKNKPADPRPEGSVQPNRAESDSDDIRQLKGRIESLERSLFRAEVIGGAIAAAAVVLGVSSLTSLPEKVFSTATGKVEARVDAYIKGPEILQKLDSLVQDKLSNQIVQFGSVTTDTDGEGPGTDWKPWRQNVGEDTVYVGLMRRVEFQRGFKSEPQVDVGLKLIDLASGSVLMKRIGFMTEDARIMERVQNLHTVARIDKSPDETGFTVKVGLGLPKVAGDKLISLLNSREPPPPIVRHYRGLHGKPTDSPLADHERFVLNWHWEVGTLDIVWIADGVPK